MSDIRKIKVNNNRAIAMSFIENEECNQVSFLNEENNLSNKFHHPLLKENKSFASHLATFLINEVSNKQPFLTASGSIKNSFYKQCAKKISKNKFFTKISDEDLLVIYMKQMMNILRNEKIIIYTKSMATATNSNIDNNDLTKRLFFSFWNKTNWDEIFPSDPTAAQELKHNRKILIDLIFNNKQSKLEEIANNFFDLTGFCENNNLLMISFLDFYLFTWLKHFGIINFSENNSESPVYITTTEFGKSIVATIHSNQ